MDRDNNILKGFAKILNIKIIIMSAILPNLNDLTKSYGDTAKLIVDREKYFFNSLFKDRVIVNYDLINQDIDVIFSY